MKYSTIILFLIFLIIGTNINTGFSYVVFALIFLFFIIWTILSNNKIALNFSFWNLIPLLFLIVWGYGVVIGLYLNNKKEYIFANNAGMVLYFIYYVLNQLRIPKEKVYNVLLYSAANIAVITFLLYIFSLNFLPISNATITSFLGEFSGGSSTGQTRVYFVAEISMFSALAIYIARFLMSKNQKKEIFNVTTLSQNFQGLFLFFAFTACIMFFTASKGYMLGYIYVLFIIPFCLFSKSVYNGKVNKKVFSFILVIVILLISLIFLGYFNIFAAISDKNDKANIARYEQLYLLIKDLTIYGRGLGAIIPGYSRNLDKPYGFELSYLSLIHKFGILSILVIILYLKTISKAMKNIFNGVEVKYSVISIGAMGFLLPSIGNPLLFAPQAVTLHCLALYLLNNRKG